VRSTGRPTRADVRSIVGRSDIAFTCLVLSFTLYGAAFIVRTSFILDGQRFFVLFDDAMVSMRYAANLAAGHGLVWNPGGERVEGFTNPLWAGWMALLHRLPVDKPMVSLPVQLSALLCLVLNLFVVRRLALTIGAGSRAAAFSAVLFTAFYLPLNNWSLQGTEVGLLALLVTYAAWRAMRVLETGRFDMWLYALLGAGTWVRIDAAVPLLVIAVFLARADPVHRRRHLAAGLAAAVVFLGSQTALRSWYYGDLLPNTYYLKMTGYPLLARVSRGALVTLNFVFRMNWVLFLAPFVLLFFRRDSKVMLLLVVLAGQIGYSTYVGGDAWEGWGGSNRYISLAMPSFFVLLAVAIHRASGGIRHAWAAGQQSARLVRGVTAIVVLFSLLSLNAPHGPESLREWLLIDPALHVQDNPYYVAQAIALQRATTPDATVAVVRAGVLPYFLQRRTVDLLGKNDRHIARLPMRVSPGASRYYEFYPGHLKWDYGWSIGVLAPDVVTELWSPDDDARTFLANYVTRPVAGASVWLRAGSPRIDWSRLPGTPAR
jgi:hypothetical protein